jgi:hypothetical protein
MDARDVDEEISDGVVPRVSAPRQGAPLTGFRSPLPDHPLGASEVAITGAVKESLLGESTLNGH